VADKSGIEWTDATWNPVRGCQVVSPGCANCYAAGIAARFSGPGQPYEGLAKRTKAGPVWTGKVALVREKLDLPVRWRRPRRIFVNSMSDLFHAEVPDDFIAEVFGVMAAAPHHTFQVLTKRPERMACVLTSAAFKRDLYEYWWCYARVPGLPVEDQYGRNDLTPEDLLQHVWLGTSVEDQQRADERIPHLLQTPAAVRFLSCEPLLGPVDLQGWIEGPEAYVPLRFADGEPVAFPRIDWVITGGESGPHARPMHPDWARSLRDQCQKTGVAYFFKQWGEYAPVLDGTLGEESWRANQGNCYVLPSPYPGSAAQVFRVGKRYAGRLLDGRTWNEFPEVTA